MLGAVLMMAAVGSAALTGCGKSDVQGAANADAAQTTAGADTANADAAGAADAKSVEEQLKLAWNFLTEGNYKEAILAFTAVIDIDPKNADAYKGRADAYLIRAEEEPEQYAESLKLAMQDYALAEQYGIDPAELEENRSRIRNGIRYLGNQAREDGDMDQVHASCDALMELALSEDEEVSAGALLGLYDMLVGYEPHLFNITNSYIEGIDRPILDFVKAHPELQDNEGAVLIMYCGSIALNDFGTAAEWYKEIAAHEYVPFRLNGTYTFRDDGFSKVNDMPNGAHREDEYDIYGRLLTAYHRHPDGRESRTTYQYGDGRLPTVSHTETQFGNDPGSYDRSYEYEDGRLVRAHTFNQTKAPYEFDYIFSYDGRSFVQRYEDPSDPSRSEDHPGELDYYGNITEL